MIHGVLGPYAFTPLSGEPVRQGCPQKIHQHHTEQSTFGGLKQFGTFKQPSHSVRPYRMIFWYHRPYHFCHSPVSTRPEEDGWPSLLEVPVEVEAGLEGWATELTVPRLEGVWPNAVASSAFRFASCCAFARSDCFFFSSICLRHFHS